LVIIEVLGAGV